MTLFLIGKLKKKKQMEYYDKNSKNRRKLIDKSVLYRDISQAFDELLDFAANRLTTPLDQLKAQHYSQI